MTKREIVRLRDSKIEIQEIERERERERDISQYVLTDNIIERERGH